MDLIGNMLTIYTQPAPGYGRLPLVPDGPMETNQCELKTWHTNWNWPNRIYIGEHEYYPYKPDVCKDSRDPRGCF